MTLVGVYDVYKRYRRTDSGQTPTLSGALLGNDRIRDTTWVLKSVSLSVRRGESIAIVGANGSGKSTLMRLIAGLTAPTLGSIEVTGNLHALLTIGETFDGLMSGAENAYTALLLAGYTPGEARRRTSDVAEFAELEEVFDKPLRTYSTGMKMRLAFASAINADPEILLIDEVLGVGDSRFAAKCAERIDELRAQGTTMLVVSHDTRSLRRLTRRALWLNSGEVQAVGPTDEILDQYQLAMTPGPQRISESPEGGFRIGSGDEVEIVRMGVFDRDGNRADVLLPGQPTSLRVLMNAKSTVREVVVGFSIHRAHDGAQALDLSSDKDSSNLINVHGPHEARLNLGRLDLGGGEYYLNGGLFSPNFEHCYDYRWGSIPFVVAGDATASPLAPPRQWRSSSVQATLPNGP